MRSINPKNVWNFFVAEETRSSSLLVIAGLLGLILANSKMSDLYFSTLHYDLTFGFVTLDIQHWINEGLMAAFFLVVSLEIKRELIDGELKGWKKASFPVFGAIGGMILPALIFTTLNPTLPESKGWAIPMATDIAIAIGILGLLGNRISHSLRVFLLTLAIVDDIGSIAIIGIFYSQPSNMFTFLMALVVVLSVAIVRNSRHWIMWFGVLGFVLWYLLILSGVPGTMAGVLMAFLAPLSTRRKGSKKLQLSEVAEDILLPFASFVIVPMFVLANAGIPFSSIELNDHSTINVFLGVFLGLVVGKAVGIFIATKIANVLGFARKPSGISWSQIAGVGFVAGIGFTVSLLVASLSYEDDYVLHNASVMAIFIASIVSAIIGLFILSRAKDKA
ncbi:Na+/H+ antiporter NhaA [Candidatus Saccharibacteria bacterium]|nr:Na+/H+ antiporter NhaA [Candidatus Saccharibacteria bacterium]